MTSTKVECQEMHSEGPHVEEIASYSYTIHQEDGSKPQNGVVIEEYSEGEDNRAKLQVNRGVSIVSVSDDESTMKAISRDVSADDIHAELIEDHKFSTNGSCDEVYNLNGRLVEERTYDDHRGQRGMLFSETIIEERSIDESLSEIPETKKIREEVRAHVIEESRLSRRTSVKVEQEDRRGSMTIEDMQTPQTPTLEKGKYSKERSVSIESSLSRQNSIKTEIIGTPEPQTPVIKESIISKEKTVKVKTQYSRENSSKIENVDAQEAQTPIIEDTIISKEKSVKVKTQYSRENSSKIEDINAQEPQTPIVEESKYSRQSSVKVENKLSRQNSSQISVTEKTESQTPLIEESKLSRQSSRLERLNSTESKKSSKEFSRENSQKGVRNDDEEVDEEMEKLFERIKRQRSVLDEILDKTGEKEQNGENSGETRFLRIFSGIVCISFKKNIS